MKFVELPSLRLPPGQLTVWRALAPPPTGAPWEADSRRASHGQEAHIAAILDEVAGGQAPPPSWLGCTFELPADLHAEAFATALRSWIDRHEVLRSHLAPASVPTPPGALLNRVSLPPDAVTVTAGASEDFADERELARHLEDLFDREASPLRWPGYLCATIRHAAATTVCVAADHSLMDGYSALRTVHELHALYTAALAGPDSTLAAAALAPAASYLDFAEDERRIAEALTSNDASIARWRRFVAGAGGHLPAFPVPVSDVSGVVVAQSGACTELLDAPEALAFDQVCRAANGDAFAGVLACLAKVGHDLNGAEAFRTMAPFNTRTDRFRSSMGWFVGMGPIGFSLRGSDSFATAMRAAIAGLDGVKDLARIPMRRVSELLDQPLSDPFMVSYSDFRRTPGSRHWNTWKTVVLRARSAAPDDVYFWVARTHNGLSVSYRYPGTPAAATTVADYVARARQLLMSVAHSGQWPVSACQPDERCA